jgi:DNA processing protein
MERAQSPLTDDERIDWLRLIRTKNVGPRLFIELLDRFGTAAAALDALPGLARRGGSRRKFTIPSAASVAAELSAIDSLGARTIGLYEPDYPETLAAIADPPPLLFVSGDVKMLRSPSIAIVGARNASSHSRRFAEEIAGQLGEAGYTIVSGLARGIDAAAHNGALKTGTMAAIAGGLDVVYPPEHEELQRRIAATGAVVSEHPPGTRPTARHFPARNRLISGLARGVLVVEAALKSGSLITARLALEQGRDVFAVPGSPRDPRCRGTNDLIRQGAVLTESAADIVEAVTLQVLKPQTREPAPNLLQPPNLPQPVEKTHESEPKTAHGRIIELLGATPTSVDELVRECHMSAASVQSALLELELTGRIERHPGNRISLVL